MFLYTYMFTYLQRRRNGIKSGEAHSFPVLPPSLLSLFVPSLCIFLLPFFSLIFPPYTLLSFPSPPVEVCPLMSS